MNGDITTALVTLAEAIRSERESDDGQLEAGMFAHDYLERVAIYLGYTECLAAY